MTPSRLLPDWLPERKRRQLRKRDPELRRQFQLIQDLEMPSIVDYCGISPDGQYLISLGTYKPRMRCFHLDNLAMKFERCLDSSAFKLAFAAPDYSRVALLMRDRWVEFHNKAGVLLKRRVPVETRDMAYVPDSANLYVCGASHEIFRLSLEQGRFLSSLTSSSVSHEDICINALHHCPANGLIFAGTTDGHLEAWDTRVSERGGRVSNHDLSAYLPAGVSPSVSALQSRDFLTLGAGVASGRVLLFDLRQARPMLVRDNLNDAPIHSLSFHEDKVLSSDRKAVKIWAALDGALWTGFEAGHTINSVCHVPESGLMLISAEHPKVLTYYIRELGPAPKWCCRIDNMLEDFETEPVVYDDYRFVTRPELDAMGLAHLVGSDLLRAYMHGFFMDARLYTQAQSLLSQEMPYAVRELQRLKRVATAPMVNTERVRVAVNRELQDLVTDDRFGAIFTDPRMQVDVRTQEFKLVEQAKNAKARREKKRAKLAKRAADSDQIAADVM